MTVTVADFYERGKEPLSLDIAYGEEHMGRPIKEGALNRPGLALAGFLDHFANLRVQVLGLAEGAYLKSLPRKVRGERLNQMFEQRIPCIVVTRSRQPFPETLACAEAFKVPVLRSPLITNKFINQATLVMETLRAPCVRYQGTMLEIRGMGVLMEGPPGIGKSETALALIERGHSLVSDDLTVLRRDNTGTIMGYAEDVTRFHMEIRGLGIIHIPSLFGVSSMRREMRLDMVIRLERYDANKEYDRTGLNVEFIDILDESLPLLTIPVAAGRDIAHVVEVAALNQKLKQLGHDAAKELDDKLMRILDQRGGYE